MNNLKKARKYTNLNQKEVAGKIGVSCPTVSEWESGKKNPSVDNLLALADIYKVDIRYLLGLTDDPTTIDFNECTIYTHQPINLVSIQYKVPPEVLADIASVDYSTAESWITHYNSEINVPPSDDVYVALASFFEINLDDFKKGKIPLFSRRSTQLKVWTKIITQYPDYAHTLNLSKDDAASLSDILFAFFSLADEEGKDLIYKVAKNSAQLAMLSSQAGSLSDAAILDTHVQETLRLQTSISEDSET